MQSARRKDIVAQIRVLQKCRLACGLDFAISGQLIFVSSKDGSWGNLGCRVLGVMDSLCM